ncbi:PPM-type phosphatase domain-containing protein [Mycena kentingensis (nom. inval.)]|nr:PPM-type phosphatase domain-containing protein [Mycena kentingensis (nom. inval.)]
MSVVAQHVQQILGFQLSVVQYQPTDRPIEDRLSVDHAESRLLLGVYDGHGGPHTAEYISKSLPKMLLASSPQDHARIFERLDQSLLHSFQTQHPHSVVKSLLKLNRTSPDIESAKLLRSGCTALVLDIDVEENLVHFANAGDCRALVLDSTIQQTTDLNAKAISEQARLKSEHPGEDNIIVGGRLFGRLMSTRGFGDGYYKLPRGINGWEHKHYINVLSTCDISNGKVPLNAQYESYFYGYRTPPYITATPDTRQLQLDPAGILVCGSDGLFDLVSNEQIATIITGGVEAAAHNLALHLLETIIQTQKPGDDVTILVLRRL